MGWELVQPMWVTSPRAGAVARRHNQSIDVTNPLIINEVWLMWSTVEIIGSGLIYSLIRANQNLN